DGFAFWPAAYSPFEKSPSIHEKAAPEARPPRRYGRSPTGRGDSGQCRNRDCPGDSSFAASRSALASGAVKGGPATLHDAPDHPAAAAGFSFAVVNGETFREIAELAIGPSIVAQGGSASLDGFVDDLADRGDQAL